MVKRPQMRRCSFGPYAGTGKAASVLVLMRATKPSRLIVLAGLGRAIHEPRRLLVGAQPKSLPLARTGAGQDNTHELELPPSHRGVRGAEAEIGGIADRYPAPDALCPLHRNRVGREKPTLLST
jgi:hypothetical protein